MSVKLAALARTAAVLASVASAGRGLAASGSAASAPADVDDITAQLGKIHPPDTRPRRSVWSFGLAGLRHSLTSEGESAITGNSGAVQLGTGYIGKSFYLLGSLDIVLGPYEPTHAHRGDVDFGGTGVTLWTGFSAQTLDLRSEAGGYGFALGVAYADLVGRATGAGGEAAAAASGGDAQDGGPDDKETSYIVRVTNLSLMPAIFFSWLKPARPSGNSPELLATRLEGYLLTMGLAIPLETPYAARQERASGQRSSETGHLRGYSLLVSLTALLGT